MQNAIQMFKFENKQEIRVIEGENGDPLFIAKDVCSAVELNDVSRATDYLDADEKGTREVRTPGGIQRMLCVTESGMYTLIIRSNKPEARRFRKWITSEVLPSLRKHGMYTVPGRQPSDIEMFEMALNIMKKVRADVSDLRRDVDDIKTTQANRQLPARTGINVGEYYTIVGYANIRGIRIGTQTANRYGRLATKWSKDNGYPIDPVPDAKFGRVNAYHVEALEWVFDVVG